MFIFIIAMFAVAIVLAPSFISPIGFVVAEESDGELPVFRLYTTAICDNVSGFIICHDELFAKCGDFEYRLPKNEVNGASIFDEDWEDPRSK